MSGLENVYGLLSIEMLRVKFGTFSHAKRESGKTQKHHKVFEVFLIMLMCPTQDIKTVKGIQRATGQLMIENLMFNSNESDVVCEKNNLLFSKFGA